MKRHPKSIIFHILREIMMLCVCGITVIPFYYMVVNAVKSPQEASSAPMALPKEIYWGNFEKAFAGMNFLRSFWNTLLVTIISVAIIIVLGSTAAYVLSRRKNKLMKFLYYYYLIGFMVPLQVVLIPLYIIMQFFHLNNSIAGLVVLYSSWCCLAMFLYRGFIISLPLELEEAGLIDGCNLFKLFWRIVFPLLQPITVTIIIFDVMAIWNDFMYPYLFIGSSSDYTLVLEVYKGVGEFGADWGRMLATMVIVLVPIVVFYIFVQKYIIRGITSGSVKG